MALMVRHPFSLSTDYYNFLQSESIETNNLIYHHLLPHNQIPPKNKIKITLNNNTGQSMNRNTNSSYINGVSTKNKKTQEPPLWKWKGLKLTADTEKSYSIADFLHENSPKLEDSILGPGAGAGVGCGVGVGLGLLGGMGFDGSLWNHVRVAFGFGVGCGVGVGFGYGQGFGYGSRWESLKSRVIKPGPGSKKRLLIQI